MKAKTTAPQPILKIPLRRKISMILSYASQKIRAQIKSVAFISLYLVLFQVFILKAPLHNLPAILIGVIAVILGLAFFLEGLYLAIMPLGERCGLRLPVKVALWVLLGFSAVLGITATFAEPAISLLQTQGGAVLPWEAPLLYYFLNAGSSWLIAAVAIGVALAVLLGVLSFIKAWSIKPFIFVIIPLVLALSFLAYLDPRTQSLVGLAWDTGGITTGPVTVPLILALGIGVSRLTGSSDKGTGGLGIVTLASALPVGVVLTLALITAPAVSQPCSMNRFFTPLNRDLAQYTLGSYTRLESLARFSLTPEAFSANFGDKNSEAASSTGNASQPFDSPGTERQLQYSPPAEEQKAPLVFMAIKASALAILPLTFVLIAALKIFVREKIVHLDEVVFGLVLSFAGFFLFTIGMEQGLTNIGRQAGLALPKAWSPTERPDLSVTYRNISPSSITVFSSPEGGYREFVAILDGSKPLFVPFDRTKYNELSGSYLYVPEDKPLVEGLGGYIVVLLFLFAMGIGATLAEPSLRALGHTLEDLTTGTYKSSFLIRTVSIGVGLGMIAGFARILFDWPLLPILAGLYLLALLLTIFSSQEIGAIAWDSAGVTTGPITVPLVIAAGVGIGSQSAGSDVFGVLAMASVCPIITVLLSGIISDLQRGRLNARLEGGDL